MSKSCEKDPLTGAIISAAIEVHRILGPGILESAYETCLAHELQLRNIQFRQQVQMPIIYKGTLLRCEYRIDLLVEEKVIVEIKSVRELTSVHEAQILTYLRLNNCRVGLLLNFNEALLIDGIRRFSL